MPVPAVERSSGRRSAWVFGAVTVVPAMLAAAWLLPGLPLLLAGRFAAPPMVFMFAPLAVGLSYFAVRQLPASWPGFRPDRRAPDRRAPVPWWAVAGTVAVAAAFAAWQIAERTQQAIYLRDPSTYLQVGYWIAHHGSLPIPNSLAAFGGPHPGLGFASVNYYPRGSGIVPQFMTGMPVVLAAAVWLGGLPAALVITPLIGACAVLSFGGLAGRLAGPRWAPAAAAVLALSLPEQYTSRGTFSEPLAQVLLFGGLCLLADSLLVARGTPATGGARVMGATSGPHPVTSGGDWPGQDIVLAALGGLALGLTVLVRIDALSDILPAVPFLGVLLAARRRQAIPFGAGLVIGVGYGIADGYLLSRPYLDLEAPSLRPLGLITAVVVLLTLAGVTVTTGRPTLARLRRWLRGGRRGWRGSRLRDGRTGRLRGELAGRLGGWLTHTLRGWPAGRVQRWLPEAAAALTLLVFIGFAVRPLVQTVAGETDPTSIAYVAELQKLAHLPIEPRRQYYEDSLYWVIWYLGAPAVLLGAFGLAVLARRCLRALLTWKDPQAVARVWALPFMIAVWVIVTVLWRPAVSPDQPWASRRLVPFVLPGLILGAIWASAWLKDLAGQLGRTRATSAAVASCCVASVVIPTALTTFDIGLSSGSPGGLTAHGMAFKRIGAGELTAVGKLCTAIGSNASVVFLDPLTADRFAQVVRGMCGTPAAVLDDVTPTAVGGVATGIERAGRRPVLLAQQEAELTELTPYGAAPSEVVDLRTTQEAHNLTSPPTRTWLIHYTVWMSEPTTSPGGAAA